MAEMSWVEALRAAAAKLREIGELADPGPWNVELPGHGKAWINTHGWHHAWGMHGFVDEARWVALVHPGVAEPLADWLDRDADSLEHHLPVWSAPNSLTRGDPDAVAEVVAGHHGPALRLAQQLLGVPDAR